MVSLTATFCSGLSHLTYPIDFPCRFGWERRFGESLSCRVPGPALVPCLLLTARWSFGPSRRRDRSMAFRERRSVTISREAEVDGLGIGTPFRKSEAVHNDC
jgi:hypothetical protein